MTKYLALCLVALATIATARVARADESLASARDLYASAAYEEALAALDQVRAAGVPAADAFAVDQYRAFCLLALGRAAEAQTAIEAIVVADPLYHPSAADVSPRVRAAFSEVRRRLLPSIIPQQYAQAKAAFDNKNYAEAATGFTHVLAALADPDVVQAAGQSPLSDVRTLAIGFQELSARAAAPPPPPAPPPLPAEVAPEPVVPSAPRVYTVGDTDVVPPTPVVQELPRFSGRLPASTKGILEVVINERGLVEAATMRASVDQAYDRLAIDATRSWRYKPATANGVSVKFKKMIQITIKPTI
jgi:TonB family protein